MKICICTNTRPHEGGVRAYINTLYNGLKEMNQDVDIITAFGATNNLETRRKFVEKIFSLLRKFPTSVVIIYKLNEIMLFFNLYRAFIKKKYDIIHVMDFSAANTVYPLAKLFKKPIILSVHGFVNISEILNLNKKIKKYFLKEEIKAYQRADFITSAAKYIDNYILSKNISPKKIVRINNFVDLSVFYPDLSLRAKIREKLSINREDFVVLCVARMVKRKGVIYPLLSLLKILRSHPTLPIKLIYVGEGPQKKILQKKVRENHLNKTVFFLDTLPHKSLNKIYNSGDVLVVPSINYRGYGEPQGITPLEAMATGLPVIAFKVGGLPEIIRNKKNGLLIEEKNSSQLAKAIIKLYKDKNFYHRIRKNALEYIRDNHSKNSIVSKVIQYYQISLRCSD